MWSFPFYLLQNFFTIITSSCVKLSNCKVISTIDDQGLNSDPMIIRLPKYIIHNWERVVRMTSCKTRELELTMKEDNIVVVICIKTQSKDFSTLMMPCLVVLCSVLSPSCVYPLLTHSLTHPTSAFVILLEEHLLCSLKLTGLLILLKRTYITIYLSTFPISHKIYNSFFWREWWLHQLRNKKKFDFHNF